MRFTPTNNIWTDEFGHHIQMVQQIPFGIDYGDQGQDVVEKFKMIRNGISEYAIVAFRIYEPEYISYFLDEDLHNETGPAIIYFDGQKEYWYEGEFFPGIETDEEWINHLKLKFMW